MCLELITFTCARHLLKFSFMSMLARLAHLQLCQYQVKEQKKALYHNYFTVDVMSYLTSWVTKQNVKCVLKSASDKECY